MAVVAVGMFTSAEVQALSNSFVTELGREGRERGAEEGWRGRDAGAGPPLACPGLALLEEAAPEASASTIAIGLRRHHHPWERVRRRWDGSGGGRPTLLAGSHAPSPLTPVPPRPPYLCPGPRRAPGGLRSGCARPPAGR